MEENILKSLFQKVSVKKHSIIFTQFQKLSKYLPFSSTLYLILIYIQMNCSKITIARLGKQEKELEQQSSPNLLVKRKSTLTFHFCIYNLTAPYNEGFYHGVVALPQDYPFSPPEIYFLTPNGRFFVERSICTTFTHFHKNKWSHMWTIRTMLLGVISLMLDNNEKGIGFMNTNDTIKQSYAKASLNYNMKNKEFVELFEQKFSQIGINLQELSKSSIQLQEQLTPEHFKKIPDEFKFFNVIEIGKEREKLFQTVNMKKQKKKAEDRREKIQQLRKRKRKDVQVQKNQDKKSEVNKRIVVEKQDFEATRISTRSRNQRKLK